MTARLGAGIRSRDFLSTKHHITNSNVPLKCKDSTYRV